jgi:clan AA aspartic protease
MGEVRVQARLANATDEELVRRGALPVDQVRTYTADALVDTGAVSCCLPPFVAEQLGVSIARHTAAQYADGRIERVGVTSPVRLEIQGRQVDLPMLVLGDEVLIGQVALEMTDLLVDCQHQRLVPNPAHPDQPVLKVK